MQYYTTIDLPPNKKYITSKTARGPAKRIDANGQLIESDDWGLPLVRVMSYDNEQPEVTGDFGFAIFENNKFVLLAPIFKTLKEAEKALPIMHLVYPRILIYRISAVDTREVHVLRDDELTGEI